MSDRVKEMHKGEVNKALLPTRQRPTIAELEAILDDPCQSVELLPSGEVKTTRSCSNCNRLAAEVAEKEEQLRLTIIDQANTEAELNDGDYWMERAKKFLENGGCPICFCTDEAGHTKECLWGQLEAANERLLQDASNRQQELVGLRLENEKLQTVNNIQQGTIEYQKQRAEKAEESKMHVYNIWKDRAEKAEARVSELEKAAMRTIIKGLDVIKKASGEGK